MGDEVGMLCWSQVMKGLTYYVTTLQVRADSASRRGDARGSARGSMGPRSWNPVHTEGPAERRPLAQSCAEDLAKSSLQSQGEEVWSGN